MTDPNWGLLGGSRDPIQMFQIGQQLGDEIHRRNQEKEQRRALNTYAQDPSDGNLNALIPHMKPDQVFDVVNRRQERDAKAGENRRNDAVTLGKLLDHAQDEPTYQQSLAAARQLGMDVSKAPPNFDPNWVGQQRLIVGAFAKDGGQSISGMAKELVDAGYKPNTPEFHEAMRRRITASDQKTIPYTQGGGVALFNPNTGQVSSLIQPNPGGVEAGTPVGGVREGATATNKQTGQKIQYRNGQWVPIGGGGGGNVTGNFR